MKHSARKIVGMVLVVLGLLALLTPLTPGSWLIPIGLELLGLRLLLADKLLAWAKAKPGSKREKIIRQFLRVKDRTPKPRISNRRAESQP
ncbi:MAG: hypothetical protein JW993_07125 [Sedimentisphaerales bacterium]|nr:hypothetical protein [Sedimentisphaerales bacterium]